MNQNNNNRLPYSSFWLFTKYQDVCSRGPQAQTQPSVIYPSNLMHGWVIVLFPSKTVQGSFGFVQNLNPFVAFGDNDPVKMYYVYVGLHVYCSLLIHITM